MHARFPSSQVIENRLNRLARFARARVLAHAAGLSGAVGKIRVTMLAATVILIPVALILLLGRQLHVSGILVAHNGQFTTKRKFTNGFIKRCGAWVSV